MDELQYTTIVSKLDSILKLLAINAVKDRTLRDQVALLSSLGFQPKQIAEMLNKSPNHISVVLYEVRKGKKAPEQPSPPDQSQAQLGDGSNV